MTDTLRNPSLTLMHAGFALLIGLLVGFVYFQTDNDTAGKRREQQLALCVMVCVAWTGL
jgi:hypothetical protein